MSAAASEVILGWLESAIRRSGLPRPAMFANLGLLAQHMSTIVSVGEQPHCILCGNPFPCPTLIALAEGYGWTEAQR